MTLDELRQTLNAMDDEAYAEFQERFGREKDREATVQWFAYNYDVTNEHKLCYRLNLKTEQEKLANAAIQGARNATISAVAAAVSAGVALLALVATLLT